MRTLAAFLVAVGFVSVFGCSRLRTRKPGDSCSDYDLMPAGVTCEKSVVVTCAASVACKDLAQCSAAPKNGCTATAETCKAFKECARDGLCVLDPTFGICVASDGSCQASPGCKTIGSCHAVHNTCLSTGDDCKTADICTERGQCTVVNNNCFATNDADCAASKACRSKGACSHTSQGECLLAKDADCEHVSGCVKPGSCKIENGACVEKHAAR